jgi:ComEC/Rec2-related protein
MRRIATPLTFTAVGMCIILLIKASIPPLVFVFFAIICAALGIGGIHCSGDVWRKRGLSCIAGALGLLLGVVLLLTMEYETDYLVTGTEMTRIDAFNGFMTADSEPLQDKLNVCTVQLISVSADNNSFFSEAHGILKLFIKSGENFYAGELISVHGRLKKNVKDFPHQIISWVDADDVRRSGFISWFYKIRYDIFKWCEFHIKLMGDPQSSLFKALFLGDRKGLDGELKHNFYNTGSVHLLALSGLHVGIVFAFIGLLLFPIPSQKIKIIIGSVFVLGYLCLIGPKPALLRASLMLVMGGVALLLERDLNPINILCLSVIIALCFDPASIYTLSFALSYCAVCGILIIGSKLNSLFIPYLPSFVRFPLSVSLGAQIATLPLILIFFHQVYPLSFLVALILIPLVTVFIWTGIVFLGLTLIPFFPLYEIVRYALAAVYECIRVLSGLFSHIPIFKLEWQYWYWLPFLALISLFIIPLRRRKSCEL